MSSVEKVIAFKQKPIYKQGSSEQKSMIQKYLLSKIWKLLAVKVQGLLFEGNQKDCIFIKYIKNNQIEFIQ